MKCDKKKLDKITAQLRLICINKKRKEIRYYYCIHCKAYHLTSQEKDIK